MNFGSLGLNSSVSQMLLDFGEQLGRSKEVDASARGLAFWLREANLENLKVAFTTLQSSEMSVRRPLGHIFQIAPSNVDLLFLYTWSLALLTGNSISTKLGSKIDSASLNPVIKILDGVLSRHPVPAGMTNFFSANRHDPRIQEEIGYCDAVVGWGSDETIEMLRHSATQAGKAFLGFPHRFSCALINADLWRESDGTGQSNLLTRFMSEVSAFDQGACTSPKTLVVVGRRENRLDFIESLSRKELAFTSNEASGYLRFVNKVRFQQESGLRSPILVGSNRFLDLIRGIERVSQVSEMRCVMGMLPLIELDSLDQLSPVLDRQLQTLSVWGFEPFSVSNLLANSGRYPIRTVRIGATHSFDFVWDGVNLLADFTWPQRT